MLVFAAKPWSSCVDGDIVEFCGAGEILWFRVGVRGFEDFLYVLLVCVCE